MSIIIYVLLLSKRFYFKSVNIYIKKSINNLPIRLTKFGSNIKIIYIKIKKIIFYKLFHCILVRGLPICDFSTEGENKR